MFNIIHRTGSRIFITKLFNPCFQIRTVVSYDFSWHTCYFCCFGELFIYNFTIRTFYRDHINNHNIFMRNATPGFRQIFKPYSQNNQTLLHANLYCMICNPNPILGYHFRSYKFIISQS